MKLDRVEPLGSSEDPDDDGLQLIGGLEQKSALHCPTRHFDQGAAFGDEPQSPCHTLDVAMPSRVLAESDGTSSGRSRGRRPGGCPPFRCKNPLVSYPSNRPPIDNLPGKIYQRSTGAPGSSTRRLLLRSPVPEVRSGGSTGGASSSAAQEPSKTTRDPARRRDEVAAPHCSLSSRCRPPASRPDGPPIDRRLKASAAHILEGGHAEA